MWGCIAAPMVTARAAASNLQSRPRTYSSVRNTIHNRPIVRQALTSKASLTGRESNTEVRPSGILLCKELPIIFSRRDQKQLLDDWFNYAVFPSAMANYYESLYP